jgi:hypothetical protein
LKRVCGNEKSPALQASRDEMTGRRGFELEFQGLEKLRVSSIYDDTRLDGI